jgi:hypothetical protein
VSRDELSRPAADSPEDGLTGAEPSADTEAPADPDSSAAPGDLVTLADQARAQRDAAGEFSHTGAVTAQAVSGYARRRQPPAEGERTAIVGYLAQYEFSARRTLAALRDGSLVSVRLADVEAGQIDDFQLEQTDRVDAHQVKWSLHPAPLGYAEFVRDSKDRTRYIRQLAAGWERLTALHHPRRVVVHFVTNDVPSTRSNPSIPRPHNAKQSKESIRTWSFAAFLAEAWRPAVEAARAGADLHDAVPPPWAPAMAAFAEASCLEPEAWQRFILDCELDFDVPSLEASLASAPVSDAERAVLRTDANLLALAFMQLVARPDRRVEFTREQLLDEIGWRSRAEFKHTHEFPDPEIPYRSIAQTADEVSKAIDRFTNGYIAVIGSPGSGKSTLLTRTLRETPHRVVRYYAYVRDAVGGSLRRGEAVNFFHDLTVALDRTGLPAGTTLPIDDINLLTRRVHEQLARASAEWASQHRRTIILVDGLDHIPREQRPTHSLLSLLPLPEDVPDGVLFVLGTQTDRLESISLRIRDQLDESGRRVTMHHLERQDVVEIVEATADLTATPTPAERERVFELSGGHPLALNYIINRLRHASDRPVAEVLDAVEPFREGIDRQYATIWGIVEDDIGLARLLALLARARGPVRIEWVRRWTSPRAIHTVTTRLAYLFRQEHGSRWTFFHNSFRAFLIERTRGLPALGGDADLFTELADRCAAAAAGEPERADELYYRARTGDSARVLALADPEIFRLQFVAGRSATTIRDDLTLALDAAVEVRDIIALTRVLLCSGEFLQREYYAKLLPLAETWLELGDVELALGALREGASLRTSRETALRAAAALDMKGYSAEAREVFTLAEPLDVLRGTAEPTVQQREEADLLDEWIAVAPRFRQVPVLLEMIEHVRATAEGWPPNEQDRAARNEAEIRERRNWLLRELATALDGLGREEEADSVRETLRTRDAAAGWWFWSQSRAWHDALAAGDLPRAEARFAVLRQAFERGEISQSVLNPEARVALAQGYLRLPGDADAARQVLEGVGQPRPVSLMTHGHDGGWRPFNQRFALNRVLGALGDQRPLHEVVPDVPPESRARQSQWEVGTALLMKFERGIAQLGRLAGRTWVGDLLASSQFELQVQPLVRLFPDQPQLVRGAYLALDARDEFYRLLVKVAAAHGADCVTALRNLLETEWTDDARRDAWPDSLVRIILMELLPVGVTAEWVRTWLERLEPAAFDGANLEAELTEGIAQTRAWVAAGDIVAARKTLERVLGASFGNENKDDQLRPCLAWAARANREDPERTPERLAQMAAAVFSVQGAEAQRYVAPDLLRAGVAAGARSARALVEWALRNDVRGWVDALTTFIDELATHTPAAAGSLSACYRSLVLPFARAADVDVVARLSAALRGGRDAQELSALTDAIEVIALGSTRPALQEAVAGRLDEAEELLRKEYVKDATARDQVVDAFEGLSLTLRELQARVRSVGDVEDLARRLKPDAYLYRWDLILEPFLARATVDELVATAATIPQNDHAWKILTIIAERLLDVGDPRATAVVEGVLRSSRAIGWWPHYDGGGSRLTGYELLVRVSGEEGRRAAWAALRDQLAAGEVRPMAVFDGWERVVAMLAPESSAQEIWTVVSRHVAALVANAPQCEPLLLPPAADPSDPLAAADAVSGLVAAYLDHHAYALAQGAQQFFTDRLLAGDHVAEATLAARLGEVEAPKGGALLVLRALARVRGTVPGAMHLPLGTLRKSPNLSDRLAAAALFERTGTESEGFKITGITPAPKIERPLPPVFSLVHPPAPPALPRPLPARGAMLEPAQHAADLVSVFRAELDLIAEWSGVQREALYEYVAERATLKLPASCQDYRFDDEPALREELQRLGLQVTYRRPRPRRVEGAMAEAAAMLVDHERLDERHLPALARLFRAADPHFVIARPTRRPSIVAPIRERSNSRHVERGWTEEASTEDAVTGRSTATAEDGWTLLAEETWLRWLVWEVATETRVGARLRCDVGARIRREEDSREVPDPDDLDGDTAAGLALAAHVAEFSHLTADEYLTRARSSYSIVVRNLTYRFETPGRGWLALNPALAEHLGWRPAPDGLFRWLDADGRVAAESVWWQDGFRQQRPPLFDDEIGDGWQVRVSASGWHQLSAAVGACVDWRRVSRLAHEQPPREVVAWLPVIAPLRPPA